jgi:hypothetical protein
MKAAARVRRLPSSILISCSYAARTGLTMSKLLAIIFFIVVAATVVIRCVPLSRLWQSASESSSVTEGGPSACRIKGNINLQGERIYHIPGEPYYDDTRVDILKGEQWFCTEAEARSAGWRKSHAY